MVTANQTSIPSGSLSATRCVVDGCVVGDCVVDDCAVDGRLLDNLTLSASSRTFETSESFRREYRVLMTPRAYATIPLLVSQFSYIKKGLFTKWRSFQMSFSTSPTMKNTSERLAKSNNAQRSCLSWTKASALTSRRVQTN